MPEPELLDKESLRTEQISRLLRAHERSDRISLGTAEVSYERNTGRGCRGVQTMFPTTRTGYLSLAGV